uniref:Uncharacterized protein n=1 Tax=mine drainage metagenome TaxID=410659 RepID=E6QLY4_9ZZZZ
MFSKSEIIIAIPPPLPPLRLITTFANAESTFGREDLAAGFAVPL